MGRPPDKRLKNQACKAEEEEQQACKAEKGEQQACKAEEEEEEDEACEAEEEDDRLSSQVQAQVQIFIELCEQAARKAEEEEQHQEAEEEDDLSSMMAIELCEEHLQACKAENEEQRQACKAEEGESEACEAKEEEQQDDDDDSCTPPLSPSSRSSADEGDAIGDVRDRVAVLHHYGLMRLGRRMGLHVFEEPH